MNNVDISIVIPYYNDGKYIEQLVSQIRYNIIDKYEVLIVDGISDYKSRLIIENIAKANPCIRIIDNQKRITPCAINIGITEAKGDYIVLLSAHCGIAPNYIQTLVDECRLLNADAIGAIGKIMTFASDHQAVAIKYVLSSKFGVGNALYRLGVDKVTEVDTVAYACYRKEVFNTVGLFDEKLVRNQDLEFNKRIKNNDGKVYLTPDTYFVYYARDNYKDFFKNNFGNGYWSIITPYLLKDFNSESLRHYVPFVFVATVLFSLLLSIFFKNIIYITAGILLLYLLFVVGSSVDIKIKKKEKVRIVNVMIAFMVLHFSYGFGSLKGFFDILRGKYKFERPNR